MVVEHQFITTLDGPVALAAAQAFLRSLGYEDDGMGDAFVQVRRGMTKAPDTFGFGGRRRGLFGSRVRDFRRLPQAVRVEFDRGRVSVAASLINLVKEKELEQQMLTAAVTGVEAILAQHRELAEARVAWDDVDGRIADKLRRARRRGVIALCVVLGLGILVVVLSVVGSAPH